jgi:hypothetical protein
MSSSLDIVAFAFLRVIFTLLDGLTLLGFSGEENRWSIGSRPFSSRIPVSGRVSPVFLLRSQLWKLVHPMISTCLPLTPKSNKYWFSFGLRLVCDAAGAIFCWKVKTRQTRISSRIWSALIAWRRNVFKDIGQTSASTGSIAQFSNRRTRDIGDVDEGSFFTPLENTAALFNALLP